MFHDVKTVIVNEMCSWMGRVSCRHASQICVCVKQPKKWLYYLAIRLMDRTHWITKKICRISPRDTLNRPFCASNQNWNLRSAVAKAEPQSLMQFVQRWIKIYNFRFTVTESSLCQVKNKNDRLWRRHKNSLLFILSFFVCVSVSRSNDSACAQVAKSPEKPIWMNWENKKYAPKHKHISLRERLPAIGCDTAIGHIDDEFFCIFTFHSIDKMQILFFFCLFFSLLVFRHIHWIKLNIRRQNTNTYFIFDELYSWSDWWI